MKIHFKITSDLASKIRCDLHRLHPFAFERIGFISAGISSVGSGFTVLARDYSPVADEDYLLDTTVGAMMGPEAIRKALQWALQYGNAIFHVHSHGGMGIPYFSSVDVRENAKFVPDFFKVAPQMAHGAIVLSGNAAAGQIWLDRSSQALPISEFTEVGSPLRHWRTT